MKHTWFNIDYVIMYIKKGSTDQQRGDPLHTRKRVENTDAGRLKKNIGRSAKSRKRNQGFTLTYLS